VTALFRGIVMVQSRGAFNFTGEHYTSFLNELNDGTDHHVNSAAAAINDDNQ